MKSLHRSTAGAMIIVAIVAVDFAVARVVYAQGRHLVIGAAMPCVVLQIAVFKALRARGRKTAFWQGFLLFGALSTASFVDAMWPAEYRMIRRPDGVMGLVPARISPFASIWEAYERLVSRRLVPTLVKRPNLYVPRAYSVLCWAAPQEGLALLGGALGTLAFGLTQTRKNRPAGSAPDNIPGGATASA